MLKSNLFCAALSFAAAGSALAANQSIVCSNDAGYKAVLEFSERGLGTLTYGQDEETTTVKNLETSFINGVGAAVKGPEVLFIVSPAQPKNLGELVVSGETVRLECE